MGSLRQDASDKTIYAGYAAHHLCTPSVLVMLHTNHLQLTVLTSLTVLTGVNMSVLKSVGEAITKLPADFTPHRQIKKIYEARRDMIETGQSGAIGSSGSSNSTISPSLESASAGWWDDTPAYCPLHHLQRPGLTVL